MTYNPNITCDDCGDIIPMCETHEESPLHLRVQINDLVPSTHDKGLEFTHKVIRYDFCKVCRDRFLKALKIGE